MKKRVMASIVSVLVMGVMSVSAANTGGGTFKAKVKPINVLVVDVVAADINAESADIGGANVVIATGTIDNNDENGWTLTVVSWNGGKLIRNTDPPREIPYANITLVGTGGTLGTGLANPAATNAVAAAVFTAGTEDQASTATVGYAFELRIDWTGDSTLLSGDYQDTITMTLAIDED